MIKENFDLNNDYLKNQIITYLGNKRKLISFINETIDDILLNDNEILNKQTITFLDAFAGSGIVSRYAKLKGFKTYSNDLELYSKIIQDVLIGVNLDDVHSIFNNSVSNLNLKNTIYYVQNDNYQTIINYLNSLTKPIDRNNLYWSIHYAPKDTNNPNFNNERLFYTQENALKIDAIVEQIEDDNLFSILEKRIIQTSLMYLMSKHNNTNGIMKSFHNGWGGSIGAAKDRIMKYMELEKLPLINGNFGQIFNTYAENLFVDNKDLQEFDFVYADPPYNQHQYSSNYNHLNTLVLNDKYNPGPIGNRTKSGIRTDHNRSNFCKKNKSINNNTLAEQSFINFIDSVKAKYVILSYSNEGIVSIDKLIDILSFNLSNTISIKFKKYDKYKGGRTIQSVNKVFEYLIVIEKNKKQSKESFDFIKNQFNNDQTRLIA